jgi:Spy/CpxP family protein refolding chaperone
MRTWRPETTLLTALSLALALVLAAPPPLAAHGPGHPPRPDGPQAGPAGGPGGAGPLHGLPLRRLAVYLDLSDEQVAAAEQIFDDARTAIQPLAAEARDLAGQLRDALGADDPDPTAVGQLAVALHGVRGEIRAIRQTAEADFVALLTERQRFRLDALRDARRIFGRPHHRPGGGPDGGGDGGDDAVSDGGLLAPAGGL